MNVWFHPHHWKPIQRGQVQLVLGGLDVEQGQVTTIESELSGARGDSRTLGENRAAWASG